MSARAVFGNDGAIAGYDYGADVVARKSVTVTAGADATVDFVVPAP
jgi:hypothetical protein